MPQVLLQVFVDGTRVPEKHLECLEGSVESSIIGMIPEFEADDKIVWHNAVRVEDWSAPVKTEGVYLIQSAQDRLVANVIFPNAMVNP